MNTKQKKISLSLAYFLVVILSFVDLGQKCQGNCTVEVMKTFVISFVLVIVVVYFMFRGKK